MKRTTISLPDELAGAASREARRRGVSLSEIARSALTEHLRLGGERRIGFAGSIDAGGSAAGAERDLDRLLPEIEEDAFGGRGR